MFSQLNAKIGKANGLICIN